MQINGAGIVVVTMCGVFAWKALLNIVSNFIVALNLISTLGAVFRCLDVKFIVFTKRLLDQFVSVSPRLVGRYKGGGGFHVLWSNANIYVCSVILLLVGWVRVIYRCCSNSSWVVLW